MHLKKNIQPLNTVKTGVIIKIVSIPHGLVGAQFVRLGIHTGEKLQCLEKMPGGTVVLRKNRRQIAIGRELAKQIYVSLVDGINKKL